MLKKIAKNRIYSITITSVCLLGLGSLCAIFFIDYLPDNPHQLDYFIRIAPLFAVISITALLDKRSSYRFSVTDLAMLLFCGYTAFHFQATDAPDIDRFGFIVLLSALYFNLRFVFSANRQLLKYLLILLLFVGCWEAVLGLRQLYGLAHSNHHLFKLTGTFFNPGPYGGFLSVILALSFPIIIRDYNKASQVFNRIKGFRDLKYLININIILYITAIAASTLIVLILPATQSRAGWLAVGAGLTVYVLHERKLIEQLCSFYSTHRKKTLLLTTVGILLLGATAYATYHFKKDSADGRLLMWKITAQIISKNPSGVGLGFFGGAYADQQADYFNTNGTEQEIRIAGCPEYGFNEYLYLGSELGLIGLGLFFFLLISAIIGLSRNRDEWTSCLYGLISLSIFAFFSYPFTLLPFGLLLIFFLSAGGNSCPLERGRFSRCIALILWGISITLTTAIQNKAKTRLQLHGEYQSMKFLYNMELFDDVTEEYPRLYPAMKSNPNFLFEYGNALYKTGQYERSNEVLKDGTRVSSDPMFYNIIGHNYKAKKQYDNPTNYRRRCRMARLACQLPQLLCGQ